MAITKDYSRNIGFDRAERINILIMAGVFAFILSLKTLFTNPSSGVFTMLFLFLGLILAFFMHEGGHKVAAALQGYTIRIERFTVGLMISVFIGLYTYGYLPLITPNTVEMDARPPSRLQRFRKYESRYAAALTIFGGLLGSVVAMALFKILYEIVPVPLFKILILGTFLHAMYSLIPFELFKLLALRYRNNPGLCSPGDGVHLFWWSHIGYVFSLVFVLVYGLIALSAGTASLAFAIILAAGAAWLFKRWVG